MIDWENIEEEYKYTDLSMADLARKHNVNPSTLRSRRTREDWQKDRGTEEERQRIWDEKNATNEVIEHLNRNSGLNDRQKKFCLLYLKYFNATKAYQESYDVPYNTASTSGSRLLANDKIKAELTRLKEAQAKELYLDSLDIKKEWMKQAFSDITDFVEFGQEEYETVNSEGEVVMKMGSFLRLREDVEVDGSMIQEIRQGRDGVSVKLHDKQKAMEKLQDSLETSGGSRREIIVIKDDWAEEEDDGTED